MIRNEDLCVGSLTIESTEKTNCNNNAGALLVKGGICCNDNIKIEKALYSQCISTKELRGNHGEIHISGDLIPMVNKQNLGTSDNIWEDLFVKNVNSKFSIDTNQLNANNLNVLTSTSIGSCSASLENGQYNSIFEVNSRDSCKNTSIVMRPENTYLVDSIDNKCYIDISPQELLIDTSVKIGDPQLPTLSIEPENNRILMCGELVILGQGIIKSFKKINIDKDTKLDLLQQVNLLKINTKTSVNLSLPESIEKNKVMPGVTRSIIIYQNCNNCKVSIPELDIKINKGVEILFDGYKWILSNSF